MGDKNLKAISCLLIGNNGESQTYLALFSSSAREKTAEHGNRVIDLFLVDIQVRH